MSRFSDCDDYDEEYPNAWALQEQATKNALRGRRGQAVLKEMEAALVALPSKRLIHGALAKNGGVCAVGALALKRELEAGKQIAEALAFLETATPEDSYADETAHFAHKHLGMLECIAYKLAWQNDEGAPRGKPLAETEEERYERVLGWVRSQVQGPVS